MSFDLAALAEAVARHGRVARVVVAETHGSVPREAGAAMLVWPDGQEGTIGGGALEWEAAARARDVLARVGPARIDRLPLGPALGQCCGGAVVLVSEVWDGAALAGITGEAVARPLPGAAAEMPLPVRRMIAKARAEGNTPSIRLIDGWLIEALTRPVRDLWLWGAGHVGRAIAAVVAPLPGLRLTWIDTDPGRFPDAIPPGVTVRAAERPETLVAEAPADARHLVLTFSHALDLALCHAILSHGFGSLGLIGSATKFARFRTRLAALGHSAGLIARIECPIGDPALGKHPQAIAVGVAAALLREKSAARSAKERAG